MKRLGERLLSPSMILIYVILVFCAAVMLKQPSFFGWATLVNLGRAGLFMACFALCEMIVILSGGIDVSFPAIGCVSMCVPMYLYDNGWFPDNAFLFFAAAALCGLVLGLLNALLVSCLHILPLIATLATSSIASGGLILLLGAGEYTNLPEALKAVYNTNLLVYTDPASGFTHPLTVLILFPVLLSVGIAFLLHRTVLGRSLYAVGGDPEAARTAGINVRKLQFFAYCFSGAVTGLTALMYTTLMHAASATALMGEEMLVIAACVIGGCSLKGGYGTVRGTLLGVVLITLVKNHLNMLGIPTAWQTLAVGLVLLCGILAAAIRDRIKEAHRGERRV